MGTKESKQPESPATLVSILVAARKAGYRDLERDIRQRLQDEFGMKISFQSEKVTAQ